MILHIPHSARTIPAGLRDQFVLSDRELEAELLLMTDAFVDELFARPTAVWPAPAVVRFPLSRLVVDVERFPDDVDEPMSRVGMGMIYTRTAAGAALRRPLQPEEAKALRESYDAYHRLLAQYVADELAQTGRALIIDCHSFPSRPLPCDMDRSIPRPDFCLGTDPVHTPDDLIRFAVTELVALGYSVLLNQPYSGTLVPLDYLGMDRRVASLMIEVNRSLYMDEAAGAKTAGFAVLAERLDSLLSRMGWTGRLSPG